MSKVIAKILVAGLLMVLTAAAGRAGNTPTPFKENEKYGYKDAHGKVIIAPVFIIANEFSKEGIASVLDQDGWAFINMTGDIIVRPFVIDNGPDYFLEGVARFTLNGKFGFFNIMGEIVIEPQFDFASSFHESLAAFCHGCSQKSQGEHHIIQGGKWGYIDHTGNIVIAPIFESAGDFSNEKAKVVLRGQSAWIDHRGRFMN